MKDKNSSPEARCGKDGRLRVLHLSVQRELTAGQRQQLRCEAAVSKRLEGAQWESIAYHTGVCQEAFERPIVWPFRSLMLRKLYAWLVLLRCARQHDVVLLRHIPFDPFAFIFAPFVSNRISVHHSKEEEEMRLIKPGLQGRIASWLERRTGRFVTRRSAGILGMTHEIAEYEKVFHGATAPTGIFPNGIEPEEVPLVKDARDERCVNAVFICGTFNAWHGLDLLVGAVAEAKVAPDTLQIHLIGKLSEEQLQRINRLENSDCFRIHGYLNKDAYLKILELADVGIGSLAMGRQNLTEGATLKVRELLAAGIPVYSSHYDTALPEGFPHYLVDRTVKIDRLLSFATSARTTPREIIREEALRLVSKEQAMRNVLRWIDETPSLRKLAAKG